MISLDMLVYYGDAFDDTREQFVTWAEEAGFDDLQIRIPSGPTRMGTAHKRWILSSNRSTAGRFT